MIIRTNEEGKERIEKLIKIYVNYAMNTEGLDTLEGATKFKNRLLSKFEISEGNKKIEVDEETFKELKFLIDLALKVGGLEYIPLATKIIGDLKQIKEEVIENEEEDIGRSTS